jgi:type I restriction enzyme S subunit
MEVMPGYKHTEIGIIPEDWIIKTLGELGSFKNGINKDAEDFGYGSPFINLMDVFGVPKAAEITEKFGLVNSTLEEQKIYELKAGDVLFVRSSIKPEGVGLTTLIPNDLAKTVFSGFLIRFRDQGQLVKEFKEHCFLSSDLRKRIIANSTVSANTNINQESLKLIQLVFPPRHKEQQAIAEALSDMDALLERLERLILKKRDLKQAIIHQLLTGQIRLPGFNSEWEEKSLQEIANISKGTQLHISEINSEGDVPHYNGGMEPSSFTNQFNTPANTITISEGGNSCGFVQFINKPFWRGGHCYAVAPNYIDNSFLFYALKNIQNSIMRMRVGSGLPNIQKSALGLLKLQVPKNHIEQTTIAAILSDIDIELTAIEARRDKTQNLKQAMMQELLTGKTRLLKPEMVHA